MLVREKLWTPSEQPYEGTVTVELFNADTGKKEQEVVGKNYATNLLIGLMKWAARLPLGHAAKTTVNVANSFSGTNSLFFSLSGGGFDQVSLPIAQGLVLTSASHAEDPAGDRLIRGTVSGHAVARAPIAITGTRPREGTANAAESEITASSVKWVFDWPTITGNGDHRSVYWCPEINASDVLAHMYVTQLAAPYVTNPLVGQTTKPESFSGLAGNALLTNRGMALDPDGVTYWTVSTSGAAISLVRRNLADGSVVSQHDNAATGIAAGSTGLVHDGTNLWLLGDTGQLRKVSPAGVNVGSVLPANGWVTTSGGTKGLGWGNGHLWLCETVSPFRVFEIDPATGNVIQSWTRPNGSYNVCYVADATNGDEIWLAENTGETVIYSTSGVFRRRMGAIGGSMTAVGAGFHATIGGRLRGRYPTTSGSPLFTPMGWLSDYFSPGGMFYARTLLPALVQKTSAQTMKLTYQFDYV